MKLYDIDKNWDQVLRYLNNPMVQVSLDLGMSVFAESIPDPPGSWKLVRAPWMFSSGVWDKIACSLFEASPQYNEWEKYSDEKEPKNATEEELEAWYYSEGGQSIWLMYREFLASFYPQPNTPDWYRCYGAEKFLGAFNCSLGVRVAPHLQWFVVSGAKHTTAIGYEGKEPVLCFDILAKTDENPEYILGNIRPLVFKRTLGADLVDLHRCLGKGAI